MSRCFRRILVTGASGFVGRPLVQRLVSEGYTVTAVGGSQKESPFGHGVEYAAGDLARGFASVFLHPWRWDAVIHLAGPLPAKGSTDHFLISQHVNILLGVLSALPPGWTHRWIHASSMTVYGMPRELPLRESHERTPLSAYGSAKILAEDILFSRRADISDLWCLRFPGLFSDERKSGAVFHFMRSAAEGRPLRISATVPTPWDILHVNDAVEAIVRALASPSSNPGAMNISYGDPVELEAVARRIIGFTGKPLRIENETGMKHPSFQMDIAKAREWISWPPADLGTRLEQLWEQIGQTPWEGFGIVR